MRKRILYFDLDGVIVDLEKEVLKHYPGFNDLDISDQAKHDLFESICIKNPQVFKDAEPMDGAIDCIHQLFPLFDIYFLSTPMWAVPESFTYKRLWVEEHLGDMALKRLILSHRKDLNNGSFIVDDRTANGVDKFAGFHIHYGQGHFSNMKNVLKFFRTVSSVDKYNRGFPYGFQWHKPSQVSINDLAKDTVYVIRKNFAAYEGTFNQADNTFESAGLMGDGYIAFNDQTIIACQPRVI